jgi:hypothetical protein
VIILTLTPLEFADPGLHGDLCRLDSMASAAEEKRQEHEKRPAAYDSGYSHTLCK